MVVILVTGVIDDLGFLVRSVRRRRSVQGREGRRHAGGEMDMVAPHGLQAARVEDLLPRRVVGAVYDISGAREMRVAGREGLEDLVALDMLHRVALRRADEVGGRVGGRAGGIEIYSIRRRCLLRRRKSWEWPVVGVKFHLEALLVVTLHQILNFLQGHGDGR